MSFDPKDLEALAGSLLQKGLPALGGILGGPVGAVVGNIAASLVPQIAGAFGLAPDTAPAVVAATVTADPNAADKLAALESTYADLQNARQQTIDLAKEGSSIAWATPVISLVIVVGFYSLVVALLFKSVPDSQGVMILFGSLATAFGQVCNYWLGSSQGSTDKTATLSAIARRK
jgi:hypothetical protein